MSNNTNIRFFELSFHTEKIEGTVRTPGSELDADRLLEWVVGRVFSDLVPVLGLMREEVVPTLAPSDEFRTPVLWALADFYGRYRFEHALEKTDKGPATVNNIIALAEGDGHFELDVTVGFSHTDDPKRAQAMLDEWLRIMRLDAQTQFALQRGDLKAQHLIRAFGLQGDMPQRYKLFKAPITGTRRTMSLAQAMIAAAAGSKYAAVQQPVVSGGLLDQLMSPKEYGPYQPGELSSSGPDKDRSPER